MKLLAWFKRRFAPPHEPLCPHGYHQPEACFHCTCPDTGPVVNTLLARAEHCRTTIERRIKNGIVPLFPSAEGPEKARTVMPCPVCHRSIGYTVTREGDES